MPYQHQTYVLYESNLTWKQELQVKFQHWMVVLPTVISATISPHTLTPHFIVIDRCLLKASSPHVCFLKGCSSITTFLFDSCWFRGKHCPSRRSCNWCFMWVFPADVVAALDQGLSAPGCRNNPLIVPLNRKWVGRKGAVGRQFNGFSSGRREKRGRESK